MSDADGRRERRDTTARLTALVIDGVIQETLLRHYDAETQEHQLTSRLAEALERKLEGIAVNGFSVEVRTQELSDRGSGSKEKPTGADLYISVAREGWPPEENFSKGMLIQAKWDTALPGRRGELSGQAEKMLARSGESYVWVYERMGVAVIPANDVMGSTIDYGKAITIGELIAGGIECTRGDPAIGRDLDLPLVPSLNAVLSDLSVERAISVTINEPG